MQADLQLLLTPPVQAGQKDVDDGFHILLRQRMEHDDLIDPVQEFRAEHLPDLLEHLSLHVLVILLFLIPFREPEPSRLNNAVRSGV